MGRWSNICQIIVFVLALLIAGVGAVAVATVVSVVDAPDWAKIISIPILATTSGYCVGKCMVWVLNMLDSG